LNGIPGHTNKKLITKTLKENWGFKGFVVSDWEGYSHRLIKQLERYKHLSYQATITVKNTGEKTGKEVVQCFISHEYASVVPVNKKLKGFEKIDLAPGESKNVIFKFTRKDLRFIGEDKKWLFEPGTLRVSCGDQSASFELK